MRLNHLDLPVPDVAATRDFFVAHFGFRLRQMVGNDVRAILDGEDGFVLVISQLHADGAREFPRDFHLGFLLPSKEAVDAAYQRLVGAGVTVKRPPIALRGGWTMYLDGPGGLFIEVSWLPVVQERA